MFHQLFTTFKSSSAIALILLLTSKVQCLASEYIFTAPPEVGHELLEIPSSETEYPLYECELAAETESETALDPHDCECIDCESATQDSESDQKLTSETQKNR